MGLSYMHIYDKPIKLYSLNICFIVSDLYFNKTVLK